jgi:predicted amidohydrolase YtcJ
MSTAGSAGAPNLSADQLDRLVAMVDKRGWQIFIHAIGDRAIRMSLDAFERAAAANPRPPEAAPSARAHRGQLPRPTSRASARLASSRRSSRCTCRSAT